MGVLVDETTRVVVQGITGREARLITEQMVTYDTAVVAGVSPGHYGERVAGIPIYDTVADAVLFHQPTATLIAVPPAAVLDACLDALSHGIRLLVIATEGVARDDTARLLSWATDNAARVIGPNAAGIINPANRVKVGALGGADPDRTFPAGRIGIIAGSGGMTSEIGRMIKQVRLGVSTAVSLGSDPLAGTTPAQILPLFERDPETDGVVLVTEPNTEVGEEIATLIREQRYTKPLIALGAARFAPSLPTGTALSDAAALEEVGALVADDRAELVQYLHLTFHGTPYLGPDIDEQR